MREKGEGSVARAAGRMGLATLCSRVFGLVREQVFAYYFGATNAADAFNIAFRIPNLLRDLFAEGAMSAAFVPNFTRALMKSAAGAWRLLTSVLSVLVFGLTLLSVLGIAFSRPLVRLYAGAFESVPGKLDLAVGLTQMMFPFFPMVAVAAVLMGALNAMGSFFLPAFAPVLFNVGSIVCGVALTPAFARYTALPPIYSMAIGVVLGGFLQFYVQWRQIRKQGYRLGEHAGIFFKPFREPGTKRVLWLLVPGTVGLAATQMNILVNSVYATNYGVGAVSWLNYAFRFMQFPIGIFGVSLAAATLPQVTRKLESPDPQEAASEVVRSLKLVFAVNGPAAAGLMAIGLPIVQAVFQHGRFAQFDSEQAATALFWYAIGLPGYSVVKVLVPVFYALGSTRAPVAVSFLMVFLNLALNHVFQSIFHLPFWSLAAATSAVATLNAALLFFFLRKKIKGLFKAHLLWSFAVHFFISVAVGFSSFWASAAMGAGLAALGLRPGIFLWSLQVGCALFVAGAAWVGGGKLLRNPEICRAVDVFEKKLFKKVRSP